jgi:carotenoid cleavage dioxygenase-like enzyme
MVKEGTLPFKFEKRPARFGVLPRYAKDASEIKWFETETMIILHVVNAWQEGSKVKLFGCAFKEVRCAHMCCLVHPLGYTCAIC